MKQSLLATISMLVTATTIANVYAGGSRLDYPYTGTDKEADCCIDGYAVPSVSTSNNSIDIDCLK
jgi:hypothetical protein